MLFILLVLTIRAHCIKSIIHTVPTYSWIDTCLNGCVCFFDWIFTSISSSQTWWKPKHTLQTWVVKLFRFCLCPLFMLIWYVHYLLPKNETKGQFLITLYLILSISMTSWKVQLFRIKKWSYAIPFSLFVLDSCVKDWSSLDE